MHQLKHEIPLLIYEERRCAARGQKRIHLDRTKTFCHHFIAARRRLGSGSPFASLALPPMLSLPPSHLVCADLLPPRPPQRNASLCSRFTTDPSRVLSYLSLVPRTSSSPPSPPPSSLYLGLPPLSSPARFAAAETIVAVALVAVQPLPSDPEYIALRVANERVARSTTNRPPRLPACPSVCLWSERAAYSASFTGAELTLSFSEWQEQKE